MKQYIYLSLFLVLVNIACAQDKRPELRWRFHSINQAGLLQGNENGLTGFQLQTINGFEHNNLFAGIGAGLDYYKYKTVPLFADIRKYFGRSAHRFFIYENGGTDFILEKKDDPNYHTTINPGFYNDVGLGCRVLFRNSMGLLFSAGYSYKNVTEKRTQEICPFAGPCFEKVDKYTYHFNRVAVKIGWQF